LNEPNYHDCVKALISFHKIENQERRIETGARTKTHVNYTIKMKNLKGDKIIKQKFEPSVGLLAWKSFSWKRI